MLVCIISSMSREDLLQTFRSGTAHVEIYASNEVLGSAAAELSARLIADAIKEHRRARVIAATGNSQISLVEALVKQPIDWRAVELFHMDEYAGMSSSHPASFRRWIKNRLEDKVHPRKTYYLAGDAADLEAEIKRYSELLLHAPIDLAFVGFGENGHGSSLDAVALATPGGDEIAPQFLAYAEDVHVHKVGKGVGVFIEKMLIKGGACDQLTSVKREVFENCIPRVVRVTGWPARVTERARLSMMISRSSIWDRARPAERRIRARSLASNSDRSNGLTR